MSRMLQKDIEELVAALDAHTDMMDVRVEGFCLWPSIKVVLWRYLSNSFAAERGGQSGFVQSSRAHRAFAAAKLAVQSVVDLARGAAFFAMHRRDVPRGACVFVYADRITTTPEGAPMQGYFGPMAASALNITDRGVFRPAAPFTLSAPFFNALAFVSMGVRLALRLYPKPFYEAVDTLTARMNAFGRHCEGMPRSMALLAAARFVETMRVYRVLFKHIQPRNISVTDFDACYGIIAAAKTCGIPVYDMQHGTFWSGDLDHSWTGKNCAAARGAMPFPDKLFLFGPFWRDIALEQGLWQEDALTCVGSPVMDLYLERRKSPAAFAFKNRIRLLYVSGDICPDSLTRYLERFMSLAEKSGLEIRLQLRLHPREDAQSPWYKNMTARHKGRVFIRPNNRSFLSDALESDMVIGASTTAMIESLLLGLPVISLGAGATPDGIAAIHKSALLGALIPHAQEPEALLDMITQAHADPAQTRARLAQVEEKLLHFYTRGYSANMQKALSA